MTLQSLETAALNLSPRARAKLAATLLSSLEYADPREMERVWVEEADRRFRAYRSGRSTGMPSKQAIAWAKSALRS
jgi:hypothetical protein